MSILSELLGPSDGLSPFERGERDYHRNVAPPAFSTPDSSWEQRLYRRGWEHARWAQGQARERATAVTGEV